MWLKGVWTTSLLQDEDEDEDENDQFQIQIQEEQFQFRHTQSHCSLGHGWEMQRSRLQYIDGLVYIFNIYSIYSHSLEEKRS